MEGLIGETGTAVVDINKSGKIMIHGEYWNAQSDEEIKKGESVEVIESNGMVLKVKRKNN